MALTLMRDGIAIRIQAAMHKALHRREFSYQKSLRSSRAQSQPCRGIMRNGRRYGSHVFRDSLPQPSIMRQNLLLQLAMVPSHKCRTKTPSMRFVIPTMTLHKLRHLRSRVMHQTRTCFSTSLPGIRQIIVEIWIMLQATTQILHQLVYEGQGQGDFTLDSCNPLRQRHKTICSPVMTGS